VRGITDRLPQPSHGRADALIEADDGSAWPKEGTDPLARDRLARLADQGGEDFEGLAGDPDSEAVLAQDVAVGVELEDAEPKASAHRLVPGLFFQWGHYHAAMSGATVTRLPSMG
jgi:hypothetical protein